MRCLISGLEASSSSSASDTFIEEHYCSLLYLACVVCSIYRSLFCGSLVGLTAVRFIWVLLVDSRFVVAMVTAAPMSKNVK